MSASTSTSMALPTTDAFRSRVHAVMTRMGVKTLPDGTYLEEIYELLTMTLPLYFTEAQIEEYLNGEAEDQYSFLLEELDDTDNPRIGLRFCDYPNYLVHTDFRADVTEVSKHFVEAALTKIHATMMSQGLPIPLPKDNFLTEDGRPYMQYATQRIYFLRLYQYNATININHLPPFMRHSASKNQQEHYVFGSGMIH